MFSLARTLVGAPALDRGESARAIERDVLGLFDSLQGGLLRYAVSFGLPVQDAEDVVQETFLALFHHLRRGRSRSNLRGWAFRVTHNLALTRQRVRRSEGKVMLADAEERAGAWHDPQGSPEEHLLFGERQMRLQGVYRALPERDRWCLQLRAEGLRYREIGQIVGISLGSVANSIAGSMRRLEAHGG
jgi:RNA polymerase sigma-70 factor (ECF subfamily)